MYKRQGLSPEEYDVFYEAALLSTETELKYWDEQIEEAKKTASEKMGVTFIETDMELFQQKVSAVQQNMLDENKSIRSFYEHIQEVNKKSQQEVR